MFLGIYWDIQYIGEFVGAVAFMAAAFGLPLKAGFTAYAAGKQQQWGKITPALIYGTIAFLLWKLIIPQIAEWPAENAATPLVLAVGFIVLISNDRVRGWMNFP